MLHPKLRVWFDEYAADHKDRTNQRIHKVAIPLIVFHIVAMLDWIVLAHLPTNLPVGAGLPVSVGHVFVAAALLFYLRYSLKYAVVMGALVLPLFPLGAITPRPAVVGIAVGAWIAQLVGHAVYEKARPSFTRNILQALIGPIFFVALLLGDYPPTSDERASDERASSEGAPTEAPALSAAEPSA